MLLPGFGTEAQHRLMQAKVLVIGAGGLGCPCIQYLVGAGTGVIGICDGDTVEISNLHRQIVFTTDDAGKKKVHIIKSRMENVVPGLEIKTYDVFLDNQLAVDIFPLYDIVIDCTDDINTRFLINDACVLLNKPLVYGAVFRYEGQVAVFNTDENNINLRDVFNDIKSKEILSCNESGALGAITGMVGTMQALEAIKFVTKINGLLKNEILFCNFLTYNHYIATISKSNKNIYYPKTEQDFLNKNYRQACMRRGNASKDLNQTDFLQKMKAENVQVVDVRNKNELPLIDFFEHENIPLHDLLQHPEKIDRSKTVLLFCHAGIRSQTALDFLIEECKMTNVFHLKGGILKWNNDE